jgi:hypothetical protein
MTTTAVWYGRAARADTAADQLRHQHHDCRPVPADGQDYPACYFDIGHPGPETRPAPTPAMPGERVGPPCAAGPAHLPAHAAEADRRLHRVACWSLERISRRTDAVSHIIDRLITAEVELPPAPAAGLPAAWAAGDVTGKLANTVASTVPQADHAHRAAAHAHERVRR